MGIIEKYAYHTIYKKARAVKRNIELPKPDRINKVAVLWQPGQEKAFQYLHDYFAHQQAIFRNLCVFTQKVAAPVGSNVLTPGELNWLGLPKPGPVDDFIDMEFDLLLNIALNQTRVLDYITALSRAKFKIGWSPLDQNFFDLNINIGARKEAMFLAEQQIFYLAQLNKTA